MIKYRRGKLFYTGKDYTRLKSVADDYGISFKSLVTGMIWEAFLLDARAGKFKKTKQGTKESK